MAGCWFIRTALFCTKISALGPQALVSDSLPVFDRHAHISFSLQIAIFYNGIFNLILNGLFIMPKNNQPDKCHYPTI